MCPQTIFPSQRQCSSWILNFYEAETEDLAKPWWKFCLFEIWHEAPQRRCDHLTKSQHSIKTQSPDNNFEISRDLQIWALTTFWRSQVPGPLCTSMNPLTHRHREPADPCGQKNYAGNPLLISRIETIKIYVDCLLLGIRFPWKW